MEGVKIDSVPWWDGVDLMATGHVYEQEHTNSLAGKVGEV